MVSEPTAAMQQVRRSIAAGLRGDGNPTTAAALTDLAAYAQMVFKDSNGENIELQGFHRKLVDMLLNERRVLLLLPRGSGKSTLSSIVYPTWRIGSNRNTRIIIASNTISQAQRWLREIEGVLKHNETYRSIFGNLVPDNRQGTWTDTEKIVLGRSPYATHLSFLAVGVGTAILGARADIIIADDIVSPENSSSPVLREHLRNWFWKVMFPILEPTGQLIVIGTRFSRDDLYAELMDKWGPVIEPQKKPDVNEKNDSHNDNIEAQVNLVEYSEEDSKEEKQNAGIAS